MGTLASLNSVGNHCPLAIIFEIIVQICPSSHFQESSNF